MTHEENFGKVKAFMEANKLKAYSKEEVARLVGVSEGSAKSSLRTLYQQGVVEKQRVKEHDGVIKAYFFWKRCGSLVMQRCVKIKEGCPAGDTCCIFCERTECTVVCETAKEYRKKV